MLNQISIHGRLTRDPELKTIQAKNGDTCVCNFSVAVNRDYGDGTDFFNCFMFGKRAEALDKFFAKGKEIIVRGSMQCDPYEKEGKKHYPWKLRADGWDFVGKKDDNGSAPKHYDDVPDSFEATDDDMPF